ncbi:MAG: hypothetical protein IKX84_04485, partial [Clostridia bacterium]|nr:hypothetical protein [Clostridia bacterium]
PGKHLVNIADFDMVKLKSGGYYNVLHGPYDPTSANNVIAFAQMAEEKYGAKSMVYTAIRACTKKTSCPARRTPTTIWTIIPG